MRKASRVMRAAGRFWPIGLVVMLLGATAPQLGSFAYAHSAKSSAHETLANISDQTTSITYRRLPRGSTPGHIMSGVNGDMWLTLSSNTIGRVTPRGAVIRYSVPGPTISAGESGGVGGLALGPDGTIWFTFSALTYNAQGYLRSHLRVGRITQAGSIKEFSLPDDSGSVVFDGITNPKGIAANRDGNLYFTGLNDSIGRITPKGIVSRLPLPARSIATDIVSGLHGDLWFTEPNAGKIGRILPSGAVKIYDLPSGFSQPTSITRGRDGNMWFTLTNSLGLGDQGPPVEGRIGRIMPDGKITGFRLPGSNPIAIAAALDGSLWSCGNSQLDRLTVGGSVAEFRVGCSSIAAATNGNIWFTNGELGRLVPPRQISGLTIGSFYASQKSSSDAWQTNTFVVPIAVSVFPATTANIAYYLSYAGATPGVSRFQVLLHDSTGATFSTGKVHVFAQVNGSFMTYFYNLPSYPSGNYTMDLLINGGLACTSHFIVAVSR